MYNIECSICGNTYQSRFKTKVCPDCKNRPCEVCGKNFVHEHPYDQHCCSKECRKIWINDPVHKANSVKKRDATVKMRYGVSNVSKLDSCKDKIMRSKKDKENYFKEKIAELEANKKPLIRNCILCGKPFEATGSQTTCTDKHYRNCVICGELFEIKHISVKTLTCSSQCKALLRKQNIALVVRKCAYCGKEFYSESSTAIYCEGPHYANCIICGKQFQLATGGLYAREGLTCSNECRQELTKQTNFKKYGVEYFERLPEYREKFKQLTIASEPKRQATNLAKWGFKYASQNPSIRKRISETISSKEWQDKNKDIMQQRYGVNYAMQNKDIFRAFRRSASHTVAADGTKLDSSWEKIFYDFLLRNHIPFEYNSVSLPYEYNGETHLTYIDFKVGDLLFEVKGDFLLEGAYDIKSNVPIAVKLDVYRKNHVVVICDSNVNNVFGSPNSAVSNGLKYLDKCANPLIGVDIKLFDNPTFPFAEDRPYCFYKVKVDNSMSSLEAFCDESIRWKMILNRINYSGGFIDSKQVLNAMNITRTCKQPSWFSKSLAKRVISNYCTSEIIVDPFAGWGMRHDAAVECRRTYIGSDFNPELVKWHNEHNRNIQYADANDFKYDGQCSVFICPPYSDPNTGRCFEDYNFEGFDASAKSLSQCDWLKIVMKNVPNAKEYVMVCKIVDDEFKNNIVETIVNKSHFGTNNEYIVLVRGNWE